ncbi:MAG: hypothetical protein LAN83_08275 [Acidobacteriia bacterium]|nr:hypothetical protein [Terriglobia bacterium]
MRASLTLLLVVLASAFLTAQTTSVDSSAVTSMERKLERIKSNGALPHPDQTPTEFTEHEINAYLASGKVKLPVGVRSVHLEGQPEIVTGTARVDFDQLKAGRRSSNPLLSVFTGIHDVVVVAHAHGAGGQAFVNVDSVSLDNVDIPRFVLQMFVDKYLQPKYPNIGLDSRFALPNRIDTARVGAHKLTVTQK